MLASVYGHSQSVYFLAGFSEKLLLPRLDDLRNPCGGVMQIEFFLAEEERKEVVTYSGGVVNANYIFLAEGERILSLVVFCHC